MSRRVVEDLDPTLPPGLTPAQHEAIIATDPLLCVLAGAGAGKTRVLTLRVARRIVHGGIDPGRVLVCTFSRKAADELRQRLWSLDVGEVVRAGTFHRTAFSLLRQQRADRGLPPPTLTADRRSLLGTVVQDAGEDATAPTGRAAARSARPSLVAQLDTEIGWAKSSQLRPDDYAERATAQGRRTMLPANDIADLYQRYEDLRRRQRVLDLDDLLSACATVLAEDVAFAEAVRWRYRHLFVDEMQDVTPAQFRLLTSLLGDEPDLMVVGDPNQSVYGWNGADPTLIDRLPSLLPGTRVIALDENHRCSPQVLAVATAALGLGGVASGPARASTSGLARTAGTSGLARTAGTSGLARTAGDAVVRGAPTSTRPDGPIPALVAHQTDDDEAAWVAHQVWLAHRPGRSWSQIAVLARTNAQLDVIGEALARAMIPHRHAGSDLAPASDLRATDRETPAGSSGTEGGQVVLATFHRAKGLQWPAVFVIGLSAGLVPIASSRTAEAKAEERRLLYVALTRAEDQLTCSWARFRGEKGSGGAGERAPSPWLAPMARAVDSLTRQSSPLGPRDAARRVAELRTRLRPADGDSTGAGVERVGIDGAHRTDPPGGTDPLAR